MIPDSPSAPAQEPTAIDWDRSQALTIASIIHGAYGDCYEQLICLKHRKQQNPGSRLILFFASEHRCREFGVFDLSFAEEIYPASAIG